MKSQVPVVTATFPIDRSCQYREGSFPYFKGLGDSVVYVFGIICSIMLIFYFIIFLQCYFLIYIGGVHTE